MVLFFLRRTQWGENDFIGGETVLRLSMFLFVCCRLWWHLADCFTKTIYPYI
jgi:hypothetical protein